MNHIEMFSELPNELIFIAAGTFVVGWVSATIVSSIGARFRAEERDPRDARIRGLEAETRIARTERKNLQADFEQARSELKESVESNESRDNVISELQLKLGKSADDLKDSVVKTRELRTELADRATQGLYAEAKIREVETELSLSQASTDMIATGVLDYSFIPANPDSSDAANNEESDMASERASKAIR
jgi:uncharacterized protein (DUF3084 family)